MNEVSVKVDSSVNAPSLSRSRLVSMKHALGDRFDDVVLVVSELVSNSVRHGSTQTIEVKVRERDGRIRVEVTDDGPGFAADAPRGEGLGLSIVERVADRWGMQDGNQRFTVWAEMATEIA
jgi:anti-sigma regulatory factor (Ser/Thr protein kinase)